MDDITLCQHVHVLGDQIGLTEIAESTPKLPFNANGTLSPKQLSRNMTAAFRLAARIYLCSLVPGFHPSQTSCLGLVEKLTTVLGHIPSGPAGFDRSLSWVYLIGGAFSTPGSSYRAFFEDRIAQLGDLANFGSFGRVTCLLRELWGQQADSQVGSPSSAGSEVPQQQQYVHWRDVMRMKGWDFLLI
jgi:hypothetical protein